MTRKLIHRIVIGMQLLAVLNAGTLFGQPLSPSPEYQVEATFIFNFAKFTQWPSDSFHDPAAPFVIGILGEDPFGSFIDEIVQGEFVDSHPIVVRRFTQLDEIANANLLFVSQSTSSMRSIVNLARAHHVLTVSDLDHFTGRGGMIYFFTENNKIRFEINMDATRDASLMLSSRVLRLATICCDSSK